MLTLALKCLLLFLFGTFLFDCVHYTLHIFENSRFRALRWLGGLHAVHHEFLDRGMKLRREHGVRNLVLHVLPEYGTAVVGMAILSHFVFGWLAGGIVIGVRSVAVIVYLVQRGEDFTHTEMDRISAHRSLIWVGPNYHALHHVYVTQHYSSFVNLFDMIFGTNGQIRGRRFLVSGFEETFAPALARALTKRGGLVETAREETCDEELARAEVLICASGDLSSSARAIDTFRLLGRDRLVPPEVWGVGSETEIHASSAGARLARYYYAATNMTYRHLALAPRRSGESAADACLFFIRRGFRYAPARVSPSALRAYFKFLSLPRTCDLPASTLVARSVR